MNINTSPLSVLSARSTHTIHISTTAYFTTRSFKFLLARYKWASFTSRPPVYVTFSSYCLPSSTSLLRVPSLDDSRRPPWKWYLSRTPLTMNWNLRQLYFPRALALGLISRQAPPRRRTSSHNMTMSVANIPRLGTPKHARTGSSSRSNLNKNHTY